MLVNSFSFLKRGPTLCPFGLFLEPCSSRVDYWTICTCLGPVSDYLWTVGHFRLICGFLWTFVNCWLHHCWTVLDSWVISSLGFRLELFVSLPCSEGLEWVVCLEISAGFNGWKLELVGKLGETEDSPGSSHLDGELLMQCPHTCGVCINTHHTPFLQFPEWPQYRLFHQYRTQTPQATGNRLPYNENMKTANGDFRAQRPYPVPATAPYTTIGLKHELVPPVTGQVPPLTLLLAPNEAKLTKNTVARHGAKLRIPKHHKTTRNLPASPHDSQQTSSTCWACEPNAPTTPWPVLHVIARHHTQRTAHLPPPAYRWVAPWFHHADTYPTVTWNADHKPQWLFTTTPTWPRPEPAGIAIRHSMHEPGRTGKHEHPYYPLRHSCHTSEHQTQTLTCQNLNPEAAYIVHYIYSYLTQGQPEQGLIAVTPAQNASSRQE